jgi:ABC-type transport system involved in cytochrome c biogenesis ATPase subunit
LAQALTAFELEGLADVPVRLLSTGQAKRAQLARVVASSALLWLLDEPLNGLDRKGVGEFDRALAEHRANGGAVWLRAICRSPVTGEPWSLAHDGPSDRPRGAARLHGTAWLPVAFFLR